MTKKTLLTKLADRVERVAKAGAGRACMSAWHQPKVPASLKTAKSK